MTGNLPDKLRRLAQAAAAALGLAGCNGSALECVEVSAECAPTHQPTFDNVYRHILEPKCGLEGGACHSRQGARGGLVFADADESYEMLIEGGRVIPDDPGCSELVIRTETTDSRLQMPPGSPLSEGERCTIIQWIDSGAQR